MQITKCSLSSVFHPTLANVHRRKKIPLLIRALRLQNGSSADAKRVYRSPVGSSLSATSSPDIAKLKNKEQLEPLLESWTPPA